MSQSNTRTGDLTFPAGENLTGKEDLLVKLTHDNGAPEVKLPTAITDAALYLLVDGDADTKTVAVRPLDQNRNLRIRLKGTCNPGDTLVLAAITSDDAGKVRALPAAAGTYRALLTAEEAGVDGQLIKCRPNPLGNIVVT
jgi:hypothetical protein